MDFNFGEVPTKELDGITWIAEKKYSINFTPSRKKFSLSLHYSGANSYLLLLAQEFIHLKQKILKLKQFHFV